MTYAHLAGGTAAVLLLFATLTVDGSVQGLNLREFFLLLSSTGLAYRRCELVRINGSEMDIQFLRGKNRKKKPGGSGEDVRMDA